MCGAPGRQDSVFTDHRPSSTRTHLHLPFLPAAPRPASHEEGEVTGRAIGLQPLASWSFLPKKTFWLPIFAAGVWVQPAGTIRAVALLCSWAAGGWCADSPSQEAVSIPVSRVSEQVRALCTRVPSSPRQESDLQLAWPSGACRPAAPGVLALQACPAQGTSPDSWPHP